MPELYKKHKNQLFIALVQHPCDSNLELVAKAIFSQNLGHLAKEKDDKGRTCLFHAALKGRMEWLQFFSERKFTFEEITKKRSTLFHAACQSSRAESVIAFLSTRIPQLINHQNLSGKTALHRAAKKGDLRAVNRLLPIGAKKTLKDNQGYLAVDYAFEHQKKKLVDALVPEGFDYLQKARKANTYFVANYCLSKISHDPIQAAIDNDLEQIALILLNEQPQIHNMVQIPKVSEEYLFAACKKNMLKLAEDLIKNHGLDLAITDKLGKTVFHYAAELKLIEMLQILDQHWPRSLFDSVWEYFGSPSWNNLLDNEGKKPLSY